MPAARVAQQQLTHRAVGHLAHVLDVPWACLWLRDRPDSVRLAARRSVRAVPAAAVGRRMPLSSYVGQVIATGQPVVVAEVADDPHWCRPALVEQAGLHAYAAAPIGADGPPLGVLEIMRAQPGHLSRHDLRVLADIATLTGLGLSQMQTLARVEQHLPLIVNTLTCAVGYAELLAQTVVLAPDQQSWARLAQHSALEAANLLQVSLRPPPTPGK